MSGTNEDDERIYDDAQQREQRFGDVGEGRFILDGRRRGIWDNEKKCWVFWAGMGGGMHGTPEFEALLMRALNASEEGAKYRLDAAIYGEPKGIK